MVKKPRQSYTVLALYYVGKILHYMNMRCFLKCLLSEEERGLYRGIHSAIFLLASIDLGESVIRYFVKFSDEPKKKSDFLGLVIGVTTLWYIMLVGMFIVFNYVLGSWGRSSSNNIDEYLGFIVGVGYIVSLSVILKSWYSVLEQIIWPNFLQHIVLELSVSGILAVYYLEYFAFEKLIWLIIVPYISHISLLLAYLWRIGELHISWNSLYVKSGFLKSFVIYNVFVVVPSRVIMMIMRMDTWILGKSWGWEVVGRYTDILILAILLDIPLKVMKQANAPRLAKLLAYENYEQVNQLYQRMALRQFTIATWIFSLLYVNLSFIIGADYGDVMGHVFLVLAVGRVLNNLFSVSSTVLFLSRYFRYGVLKLGLFLVATWFNKTMIDRWAIYGASIGLLISILVINLVVCGIVWQQLMLHPFSWEILPVLGAWIFIILLAVMMPIYKSTIHNIVLRTSIVVGLYTVLWRNVISTSVNE